MPRTTDINLTQKDIAGLTSADAVAAFFSSLGYDTGSRKSLTPQSIGLAGDSAAAIKSIELLSEDPEGFLRVVFVQLKSLTAKSRNDLARLLGRTNVDHLLVLSSNFDSLEFVWLDKRIEQSRAAGPVERVQIVPLCITVDRRTPDRLEIRAIRRFTWTCRDGLEQCDKLRSVFEAAAFTEEYFQNRSLFADHYLMDRLREDPAWRDNPSNVFLTVKDLLHDAARRWQFKGEQVVRQELFEPLFKLLGFAARQNKDPGSDQTVPDYLLFEAPAQRNPTGGLTSSARPVTAAFVYEWGRWLDGPDVNDLATPEENPGACVVSALDDGVADWIIVTNGRHWRLYSGRTHSRATNFYEVDLVEALTASGDTDPNEAFRYWWLFFRASAFQTIPPLVRGGRGGRSHPNLALRFLRLIPRLTPGARQKSFVLHRVNPAGSTTSSPAVAITPSDSENGSKNASSKRSFPIWPRVFSKTANSGSGSRSHRPTTSCATSSKPR